MKLKNKIRLIALSLTFIGGIITNTGWASAAGSAVYSLNPSSASYNKGANFTLSIYENSGAEAVNAIQADLTYDGSKLQYVGLDTSSSAFAISASGSGGGGSVSIARGSINPLTGKQLVAKVTFKALVGTGSTSISFANSSAIVRASDNSDIWDHNPAGGSYALKTPTTTKPPTPPQSSTGSSSPAPVSSTGSPVLSTSPSNTEQKSNSTPSTPTDLNSTDHSTFLVAIRVVDSKGKLINGAKVSLGVDFAQTDSSGQANFVGVAAGTYKVTVTAGKDRAQTTIVVDGNKLPTDVQQFEVQLNKAVNWNSYFGIGVAILAILVIIGLWRGGHAGHARKLSDSHHGLNGPAKVSSSSAVNLTPANEVTASNTTTNQDTIIKPTVITPNKAGPPSKV